MTAKSDKFDVRVSSDLEAAIREKSKSLGYATPSAFIRAAIEHELNGRDIGEALTGAEERLVATIEQVRRELFRIGRAQQALFAYVDSLAKVILTCVPEPPAEVKAQSIARAKERHVRMLRIAGAAMAGDAGAALVDLTSR